MNDPEALTIVIGYDGSEAARRGLARVRGLGPRVGRVIVVAVAPDLRSAGLSSELTGGEFDGPRLGEEASALLDAAEDPRVETRTMAGDPAAVLVEVAREAAADLLVVAGGEAISLPVRSSVPLPKGSCNRRRVTCWSWLDFLAPVTG